MWFKKDSSIAIWLIVFSFLTHLPFINRPPCGAHVWRQCNTLAMSRNFCEEGGRITEARIDRRNETNGITGSHFPLYEWLLGQIYKVFGTSDYVARIYSLLIFSFGLFGFFRLTFFFSDNRIHNFIVTLIFGSIPQLYYDSMNAMPDVLALTLSIWAMYEFIRYGKMNDKGALLLGVILSTLAGMIKFQFLILPFSSIVFFRLKKENIAIVILSATIVVAPVVLWYLKAQEMTNESNLREFGLWIKTISVDEKLSTIWGNVTSDLPEMLTGWPLFLAIVYQLFFNKNKGSKELKYIVLISFLSFAVFYFIAFERMKHHSYYFMVILPIFALWMLKPINAISTNWKTLTMVLILNLGWSMLRIIPSRWVSSKMEIPEDFKRQTFRDSMERLIPKNAKVLIGPDKSGCIYFYFTHTKGYSFENPEELLSYKQEGRFLDVLKQNGVRFIIHSKDESTDSIMRKVPDWQAYSRVGGFKVYTPK